jgi:hypothetical protein
VFAARYELNSYIVFRKRLVSKRLTAPHKELVTFVQEPLPSAEQLNIKRS